MEVTQEKISWLDTRHPNFKRWNRGRLAGNKRAAVVERIISSAKSPCDLSILDLGSGEGFTSSLFAELNKVISYDISLLRLKRQVPSAENYFLINGGAEILPFRNSSFDLIILQDVIEHIENRNQVSDEISRLLKKKGIIYISTPNKYSFLNIISDPHWGIPLVSLFNRDIIKNYFLRFFRKSDFKRHDIAELFSLKELKSLFRDYRFDIKTKEALHILSEEPDGILWSSFHLFLYNLLKTTGLFFIIQKLGNNQAGITNNLLSPTFYIVLIKN